jgi:cell division protein FtsL
MRNWQAKVRPHWTHWIEIFLAAAVVVVAAAVGTAQIYIYKQQAEIMRTQAEIAAKASRDHEYPSGHRAEATC